MSRFTARWKQFLCLELINRYRPATVYAGLAFALVSGLQHLSVRDPKILLYLAAIAVTFWRGQNEEGFSQLNCRQHA